MRQARPAVIIALTACALCWNCGGDSTPTSPPRGAAALSPSPQPATTPGPGAMCSPAPPALYGISVTVRAYPGNAKLLGAQPLVVNVDGYCERVGFGSWKFCPTRRDGDPQKVACDGVATGRAQDTGSWGPTWSWEGQPCDSVHSGCQHNADPFTVSVLDAGLFAACAAPDVPVGTGGSRCGELRIQGRPPQAPTWLQLDTGSKLLSWGDVKDTTSYVVYVKTVAGDLGTQPPGLCSTRSDQAYRVTRSPFWFGALNRCHTSYYFAVAARNSAGESPLSSCVGYGPPVVGCDP